MDVFINIGLKKSVYRCTLPSIHTPDLYSTMLILSSGKPNNLYNIEQMIVNNQMKYTMNSLGRHIYSDLKPAG